MRLLSNETAKTQKWKTVYLHRIIDVIGEINPGVLHQGKKRLLFFLISAGHGSKDH